MKALNEIHLAGADAEKMRHLLDVLEDLDDTQQVYSSATLDL
jgi:transcriptional/translational regulatory protein YebC/TACO1